MCYVYFEGKVVILIIKYKNKTEKIWKAVQIEWRELISQRKDKERKNMDSEKEWKLLTEKTC